jgi:hypothetical protein
MATEVVNVGTNFENQPKLPLVSTRSRRAQRMAIATGILLSIQLGGCAALRAPAGETCQALRTFAESIPASARYSVTLKTDWGAEPTIACQARVDTPESALCNFLVQNSSIEFMSANIGRVLHCAGVSFPSGPHAVYVEKLAGGVRADNPPFTNRKVTMELEFDSEAGDTLPYLTIAITPTAAGR